MKGYWKGSYESGGHLKKGWVLGKFFEGDQYLEGVEIKYDHFLESKYLAPHFHSQIITINIVIAGAMHYKMDGETVTVSAGEILVWGPGVVEELISCEPNTKCFSLHTPSLGYPDKTDV